MVPYLKLIDIHAPQKKQKKPFSSKVMKTNPISSKKSYKSFVFPSWLI